MNLLGVLGDVLAFVQLQPAKGYFDTSDPTREIACVARLWAVIGKWAPAQRVNTLGPEIGVPLFCVGKFSEDQFPLGVGFSFR